MSSQVEAKWPKEQLGELGHLMNGINKSAADFGFGIPFVNLMDVFGVGSILEPPEGLVNATHAEAVRYKLDIGDVLFIRSSVKPTGVGLSTVVAADLGETIFCGFIIRFRTIDGKFDRGFLKYIFHGSVFRRQLLAKSTVSANTNINQESLKTLWVEVPPLPEQRKIARILTTLDNLIEKTEALIAKYQSIKQGMMHDLFTRGVDSSGQLRPTHEQAPDLYKQSELGWIPKEWDLKSVGEVKETITSGSRGWAAYYSETGALFVRIGNLTREHVNFRWGSIRRVSPPESSEGNRTRLQEGDVLISVTADLGIIAVVPEDFEEAYINQHIALVRPIKGLVNSRWLGRALACEYGAKQFDKLNDTGAKAGLNLPTVASLKIPIPSDKEQNRITEMLDQLERTHEVEREQLAKHLKTKSGLMQDLLTGKVRVTVDEAEEACAHA